MQLTPLLPQDAQNVPPTTQETDKRQFCVNLAVLIVVFGEIIGAFAYFTLPSRDPVDLGVQTNEMQKADFCAGRCCHPTSETKQTQPTLSQSSVIIAETIVNRGCVKCPNYSNLKISEYLLSNQTVPD